MIENLGFGGASLTSIGDLHKIKDLLNSSFDLGITHYDTAAFYGRGYSEIIFGEFLKDKRYNVTVTTKFGFQRELFYTNKLLLRTLLIANKIKKSHYFTNEISNDGAILIPNLDRIIRKAEVERSFLQSIKNLNTNYIDYFMLHEALPSSLDDDAMYYLLDLKAKGHILNLGIAANVHLITKLSITDTEAWDVLQYEGNILELKYNVMHKFKNKMHLHHSVLKNAPEDTTKEKLILDALKYNNMGKVIFSTRKKKRLLDNVEYINHFG